jgi:hypothetical protein
MNTPSLAAAPALYRPADTSSAAVAPSFAKRRGGREFLGKRVTGKITSAEKGKSRRSLAGTFSLLLFFALC